MDWLKELKSFPRFDIKLVNPDIGASEAARANAKYSKALKNSLNDSLDIAIIELRKLSVLYPDIGQISLLLGCCQMNENRPTDALKNFTKASEGGLPLDLESNLQKYIQQANIDIKAKEENKYNSKKLKNSAAAVPVIIEASSNRWKKTKIASEKEKKEIMKKLNSSQREETFVKQRNYFNWVKFLVRIAIVFLLIGIIAVLAFSLPKAISSLRESQKESSEQLDWLLDRLSQEKNSDLLIQDILNEFDSKYFPQPTEFTEPSPTLEPDTTPGEVTPTLTLAPTPTIETAISDRVLQSSILISEAQDLGRNNPKQVYIKIQEANNLLKGISDNAKAIGIDVTKGDVDAQIQQLMRNVVNASCYPYYRDGVNYMENENYEDAIESFLAAYEIYPGYLDGINIYNLAKAYSGAGMVEEANELFYYIIDTYPDTNLEAWSQWRIVPEEDS